MVRRLLVLLLTAGVVLLTWAAPASASTTAQTITVAGQKVRVYTNVPLSGSATVDRAVVVVHGTLRDAGSYYDRMLSAAKKAGVDKHVAVLAPYFDPSWSNDAWKQGGNSTRGASSFAVADALLALLADRGKFPNITRTVLAGHSAGAQFVQRYAAVGSRNADAYVVMNPSSFVYLDPWRPAATKNCASSYNRYKYGLDRRTGYVGALTSQQVIARYTSRTVTVANGDEDRVDNGDLDTSCPANTQGRSRLERGGAFSAYIRAHFPTARHDYLVVPDVGHSSTAMFASPVMRPVLFGAS